MFQSERFFREAWPTISRAMEPPEDAALNVDWILSLPGLPAKARVLDAPCGFGRHAIAFARHGGRVTGVDFNETELTRAHAAAAGAGVHVTFVCRDLRDMEFSSEFELAVNLFSSIGYFSDDEDRLLIDRFWRALTPGGIFVLDTRNRDQYVRTVPAEERRPLEGWTLRVDHHFEAASSRWTARWWRLEGDPPGAGPGVLVGESEIRLYSAHELRAMLRPERWSQVDLYGGLDGTPFSLDARRLVLVARK